MRFCTKCQLEKPDEKFYPNFTNHQCRECTLRLSREKNRAVREMFGKGDAGKLLRAHAPVGEPCEICSRPMEKPCFDHDHKTGRFRGWLCGSCNTAIGKLGDNVEGLMKAVRYLEEHEATD